MARPTDYSQEILDKATRYLNDFITLDRGDNPRLLLPNIADLALVLGVARSTLYLWQKEHKEFSDILEDILALQETKLVNYGLTGRYNSTITKLMLTKHGYSDKQETDVTSGGEKLQGVVILPTKNESTLETPNETGTSA
jgi:hypothetical protein